MNQICFVIVFFCQRYTTDIKDFSQWQFPNIKLNLLCVTINLKTYKKYFLDKYGVAQWRLKVEDRINPQLTNLIQNTLTASIQFYSRYALRRHFKIIVTSPSFTATRKCATYVKSNGIQAWAFTNSGHG